MEELVARLAVSPDRPEPEFANNKNNDGNSAATAAASQDDMIVEHPRFADYKNEGRVAARQRERRQEHLEKREKAREDWLFRHRHIEERASSPQKQQNAFALRRPKNKAMLAARTNPFKNMLMHSDWLVDIPGTLSTEWTLVPSPEGRRCLVVAQKGITSVYYRNGGFACCFESALPGGNPHKFSNSLTILDCVCEKRSITKSAKFYVLDLLWWNRQMCTDSEFTFRQFFLRSKLDELAMDEEQQQQEHEQPEQVHEDPDPNNVSMDSGSSCSPKRQWQKRKAQFVALPSCRCEPAEMAAFIANGFPFKLDGLLFYFNSAYYIPEQTPLVGWLKPWMLPEILGVPVPDCYTQEAMAYANSQDFIERFNKEYGHKSSALLNELKEAEKADANEEEIGDNDDDDAEQAEGRRQSGNEHKIQKLEN